MRSETRHSIVLGMGTATSAALGLGYTIYVGRVLGPAGSADFFAAMFVFFLCATATGPISGTMARFTSIFATRDAGASIEGLRRYVARRIHIGGFVGVVAAIALLGPLARLLHFQSAVPLLLVFAIVYVTLLMSAARGALRGRQRFATYSATVALEAGLRLGIAVVLLTMFGTVSSALCAYLIALGAMFLCVHFGLRDAAGSAPPQGFEGSEVRRFALPMFLLAVLSAGFQNMDVLFAKHCFEAFDAGVYGAAAALARSITAAVAPFTILLVPVLSALQEQGRRVRGTSLRIFAHFLLVASALVVLFWRWPVPVINFLYGPEFVAASAILLLAAGTQLAGCLSILIAMTFASLGRFRFMYLYGFGLVAQTVGLAVWHDSPKVVVTVAFISQVATFLAMATMCVVSACRGRRSGVGVGFSQPMARVAVGSLPVADVGGGAVS